MYYHYNLDNKRFVFAALAPDASYGYTQIPPDTGLSKWDGQQWISLSVTELGVINQGFEQTTSLKTPLSTSLNSLVIWDDNKGESIKDSTIKLNDNILESPYSINLTGNSQFLIQGIPISTSQKKQFNFFASSDKKLNSGWLSRGNTETSDCPFTIPFNCFLYQVVLEQAVDDADSWLLKMFVNGASQQEFTSPQGSYIKIFSGLNLSFSQGDRLSLWMQKISSKVSNPGCSLYFKEV